MKRITLLGLIRFWRNLRQHRYRKMTLNNICLPRRRQSSRSTGKSCRLQFLLSADSRQDILWFHQWNKELAGSPFYLDSLYYGLYGVFFKPFTCALFLGMLFLLFYHLGTSCFLPNSIITGSPVDVISAKNMFAKTVRSLRLPSLIACRKNISLLLWQLNKAL